MLELSNYIKLSMPLKMVIIRILKNSAYQDGGSSLTGGTALCP